jgi:hypothetical protein
MIYLAAACICASPLSLFSEETPFPRSRQEIDAGEGRTNMGGSKVVTDS